MLRATHRHTFSRLDDTDDSTGSEPAPRGARYSTAAWALLQRPVVLLLALVVGIILIICTLGTSSGEHPGTSAPRPPAAALTPVIVSEEGQLPLFDSTEHAAARGGESPVSPGLTAPHRGAGG